MEKIIEIIEGLKPGVTVDENTKLLDEHVIDSLAMITLVSELCDEFDVDITAKDIVPENFATVKDIKNLIDRLEDGDILIVTKLDRLGRDAIDVQSTIKTLAELGIRIYCLALGAVDLTSATGKVTLGVLTAIAEFERDLLRERTHAGINRARAEGKKLGRKPSLTETEREKVWEALQTGESVSSIARNFKTTRQTILRIKKKLALSGE